MAAPKPKQVQQLLDARGRTVIERRGTRRSSLGYDAYHFLRTTSWTQIMLLFAALFLISNLVFASILYFGRAEILNAHGFLDDFWFSVQTIATIGYGYLAPMDGLANTVVTIESFFSIMLTALITGIFFSRFSTPSARIVFSKVAIITDHDGQRVLLLRMANERSTAIVEATVHLYLTRDEKLVNGEPMRRVYDLPLKRTTSPVFALSFLVIHPIEPGSPLYGATPETIIATGTNIVATFTGIDDQLAATVHSRYLWSTGDIIFDRRFVDLFKRDQDGKRYLDLAPIHDTEPLPPSA
ncbi:MAG: channel, inward rectifier [Myxococcales bacterium]|nr:channel, inward rectifier [Myxococcales bacterium]